MFALCSVRIYWLISYILSDLRRLNTFDITVSAMVIDCKQQRLLARKWPKCPCCLA